MSGLEDLKIRLQYNGGYKQESRMQLDKLRTLKKALIYSYQAATAILEDGREFRCLINPDKNKFDIRIWSNDHNPPHFHVRYGEFEAIITIRDGVVKGEMP